MSDQKKAIPMTEFIAQAAEAGAVRIVDVAGERARPRLMGVEEFAERLSKYDLYHYLHKDDPYYDLLEFSRAQPGLFDQFASVLMDSAKAHVQAGDRTRYKKHITDKIALIREVYLPNLTEAANILDFINMVENDPETADKVSVLPLMCGSGKSTAITLKIKEVIESGEGLGMLIVTDSNKRLDEIWDENTKNPLLGEEVRSFMREHKDDVTIMTGDTFAKAITSQSKYPVLAMTTQRFFNVLTKEEIQKFLRWKDGGRRPLILFDEEPYLNEVVELTPKAVNDIDTVLRMLLDESNTSQEDKQWCIRQWAAFREKFLGLLWEYEYEHEGDLFYYEDDQHSITEDDDRFFHIINQCKTGIRADNIINFKNLYAFKALVDTWGIYSFRQGEVYESKFCVFLDNRDKVQGLNAKVIVLDGTGDISPMYAGQEDYIDRRNGQSFVRSLSHLTIKIGDIDTSKAAMSIRKSPVPGTVERYLGSENYSYDDRYVFTYLNQESKFTWNKGTAHFGAIKGLNDYQDAKCIAQVGLNELQPVHYLVQFLARNEESRLRLSGLTPEESCEQIHSIMNENLDYADIKVCQLLADIDQNMFRSAIRSAENRKDIVYYLFYKLSHIPQLQEAIRSRYCGLLGGSLGLISAEALAEFAPDDDRWAEVIYKWYCEWDGMPKKRKAISEEIGVDPNVLKVTVSRDARLKPLFDEARETGQALKGTKGWYAKPGTLVL